MDVVQLGRNWAQELRDHMLESGEFVVSEGRLWTCDAGFVWASHTEADADSLVSEFLEAREFWKSAGAGMVPLLNLYSVRRELVKALWAKASIRKPRFFHDAPPGLAVGQDWVSVSAEGITRVPLTAAHRARSSLSIDLPQRAEAPARYLEALTKMFGDDEDGRQKVAAFQEFIGACRTGIVTNYERAIVMPGGGSNGKSTVIMGAVEAIFQPHEMRSITPNFLNQEYYLMELRGAAINAVTELPKDRVNCTERFKQVISGEDVTGRPIREMPVTFRPSAGHIFACNNFPQLSDNSKGMWRRLLVLRCDANFAKADGIRDDLVKSFREEAPQILAWALEGARRLMQQRNYTFPKSHFEEESQWRGSNDRVLQFVTDCSEGFGTGWTLASFVYKDYLEWYSKKGFTWQDRMDSNMFGAALRHLDGFQHKRHAKGMLYNFKMLPSEEWKDYHAGQYGSGQVESP